MLHTLKKRLYFVAAAYFAFWARLVLRRWQPRVVAVTGSSGKTTVMHLIEAQLGDTAVYARHANSAIGIPFDILGMPTNVASKWQWPLFFAMAPFRSFRATPKIKLYITEADCDRPREGAFLASLLHPEVVLWVSVYRTHSMNFDGLVQRGAFASHEEAIAYEFGHFAAAASKLVIANADQPHLVKQLERVQKGVTVQQVGQQAITDYQLAPERTNFAMNGKTVTLPGMHPREIGTGLLLVQGLLQYLDVTEDPKYTKLFMPPGRASVFTGKQNITIIDSTYNTGLGAMKAMLSLFDQYKAPHKWLVLGDILEQGSVEAEEHQRLGEAISQLQGIEHIVLLGHRVKEHTLPVLQKKGMTIPIECFEGPKEVLDYLQTHLQGGETLLFKGARGLEGVIEQLLADPADANKLVRRETVWVKRRQAWGLPR